MSETTMSDAEVLPGVKRVEFKQTWDDDCEEAIILNPSPPGTPRHLQHPHHNRKVIMKKAATSVTLEPMMHHPESGQPVPFMQRITYVRTAETDTDGRTILRQGAAS